MTDSDFGDSTRRVLVATPNKKTASLVMTLLAKKRGKITYEADWVSSGTALSDCLDTDIVFDVVLLDLDLHVMEPEDDALAALRLVQNKANLPVVILVGPGVQALAWRALDAGAQEYLRKRNMVASNLRRALAYAISRHRANDLRQRLEHSDRLALLGQLTAGVAHEINNPAAYVLANLKQIEEVATRLVEGRAEEGDAELVADMARDSVRGMELISSVSRELKFFARNDDQDEEDIELTELLNSTCAMTQNEIRYRAKLVKKIERLPPVTGVHAKLSQVFVNLLINAGHAIGEGKSADNQVTVSAVHVGRYIDVTIEDTGCGIAKEDLSKIFEPYYTTKPRGQGTGLGLPICAEIIQAHGGEISVTSEVGKGTRFRVRLPALRTRPITQDPEDKAQPRARRRTDRENAVPAARRQRVLLIDDEPLLLKSLARMLGPHHDVVTAIGGARGVATLRETTVDAIICDLMMPDVDGIHVYSELQKEHPHLLDKLIYLSGGVFTERMSEFLENKRLPFLEKPVTRQVVLDALEHLGSANTLQS